MKVAVTGSSGFIGSYLVPRLKLAGHEVVELTRARGVNLMEWETLVTVPPCDLVIHLAAKTAVSGAYLNPREFYFFNQILTLHALELARLWRARVLYLGSYYYGEPRYLPVDELHPIQPHNPYSRSKVMSEELCRAYWEDFGVPVISLRTFNVYGPGQTGSFLIPEIIEKIKKSSVVSVSDPRPKRDYIYVADFVEAMMALIESWDSDGFEVFNVGSGESHSVEEILALMREFTPTPFSVQFRNEPRKGEVLNTVAAIGKLVQRTGWSPATSLRDGLRNVMGALL